MNEVFRFLRSLATGEFEASIEILKDWGAGTDVDGTAWTEARLRSIGEQYAAAEHTALLTSPEARKAQFTRVHPGDVSWRFEQTLVDPDGHNDWELVVTLDVEASRTRLAADGKFALRLDGIAEIL